MVMTSVLKSALVSALLLCSVSCGSRSESSRREYFEKGNHFLARGEYHTAELAFRKALEIAPRFGEACAGLAEAELKQKKFADGMASLRAAARLMPRDAGVRVRLADLYLASLASQTASRDFLMRELRNIRSELRGIAPDGYDTLRVAGYIALADNQTEEAIELMRKANASRPAQPQLVLNLARALFAADKDREAEALVRKTLETQKSYGPLYDLLYFQFQAQGNPGEAESILRAKVANNPLQAEYRLQLAAHYAGLGKQAETDAALRPLLENPKDFPSGHMQVGDFHSRLGNWPEALRQYEQGIAANPANRIVYERRIADALLHEGKLAEAGSMVDRILQNDPKDSYARVARASLLVRSNQPRQVETALGELRKLAAERPADADIQYHLGQAHLAKGELDAAEQDFQRATRLQENYVPAEIALAEINLGKQNYGFAMTQADEILVRFPNDVRAMLVRAAAEIGLERYADARTELKFLLDRAPGFFDGRLQLGLLELAEKNYGAAEQILRSLYQPGRGDPRVLRGLVEISIAQRRFEPALRLLSAELNSDRPAEIRQMLLDLASRAGRNEKAVALAALQMARKSAPGDPQVVMMLAGFFLEEKRTVEAQACYRQVLSADPNNSVAMNNLAFSLAEMGGDLGEAQRIAETARRNWPEQPNIADTLAWVYLKQNETGKALDILTELARNYPGNSSFRYHLGIAWLQKGDKARAHRELQTALAGRLSKGDADRIRGILARIG